MDLKSLNEQRKNEVEVGKDVLSDSMPPSGFGGISRRNFARKPVVAAVDGFAMGNFA